MTDDAARSRSASRYVVDGASASRLESIVRLVSETLAFPTVRVNIVDETQQHTINMYGAGDPSSVARHQAFCDVVVRTGHPLIVQDAATHPRFAQHSAVLNGEIGSYLGVPLNGREAMPVGAVCILDPVRRTITAQQIQLLLQFGTVIERHLNLIRLSREELPAAAATAAATSRVPGRPEFSWWRRSADPAGATTTADRC